MFASLCKSLLPRNFESGGTIVRRSLIITTTILALAAGASARADDLKVALIYGKTGPLEAYAKQTETGLQMGLNTRPRAP